MVAPYAGAWIETGCSVRRSRLNWRVAPYAGAWIETSLPRVHFPDKIVAPYADCACERNGVLT